MPHPMSNNPNPHSIRRIVLPSGRTIEVVRFHDSDAALPQGLHICPACDSHLVQPVAWAEATDARWELMLGCPNCHWACEGTYTEDEVLALEDELDVHVASLSTDTVVYKVLGGPTALGRRPQWAEVDAGQCLYLAKRLGQSAHRDGDTGIRLRPRAQPRARARQSTRRDVPRRHRPHVTEGAP